MPDPLLNKLLPTHAPTPSAPAKFARSPSPAGNSGGVDDSFSNALERRMNAAGREPARPRPGIAERSAERPQAPAPRDREMSGAEAREAPQGTDREAPAEAANRATSEGDDSEPVREEQPGPVDAGLAASLAGLVPGAAALPSDVAALPSDVAAVPSDVAAVPSDVAAVPGDELVPAPVADDAGPGSVTPLLEKLIAEVTGKAATGETPAAQGEPLSAAVRAPQVEATSAPAAVPPARVEAQLSDTAGAGSGTPAAALQPLPSAEAPVSGLHAAGFSTAMRSEQGSQLPAQLPVHTPAGQRAWAEEVGNRVVWLVGRNETKAELVLTPPQMGKLEVSIHVSGDQTVAHFVAATSAARDALEQAMPRLREMMQQAGINLGETSVGTSGGQQTGQQGSPGRHARGPASGIAFDGIETGATTPLSVDWSRTGTGRVDTFA